MIKILDGVDDAGDQARRLADGAEGHLTIGCVGSATYSLLPRLVLALRETLPGVDVSVRGEMLAPAQVSALLTGEIDLALLRPPVHQDGIDTEILRRDRLWAAVPAGHRLAAQTDVHIEDLRDEEFIAHASGLSVMHSVLNAACADAGFVPQVRHEVTETSTLVTLVAAGLGVAIVPEPTAELGITGVRYLPLTPAGLGVDLIAARATESRSALLENVLTVLRSVTDWKPATLHSSPGSPVGDHTGAAAARLRSTGSRTVIKRSWVTSASARTPEYVGTYTKWSPKPGPAITDRTRVSHRYRTGVHASSAAASIRSCSSTASPTCTTGTWSSPPWPANARSSRLTFPVSASFHL